MSWEGFERVEVCCFALVGWISPASSLAAPLIVWSDAGLHMDHHGVLVEGSTPSCNAPRSISLTGRQRII